MDNDMLSSLVSSTSKPLSVRPSIPSRSFSSRSLPTSTQPTITILFPEDLTPPELRKGIHEITSGSPRSNLSVVSNSNDHPSSTSSAASFVWIVGFQKDESLGRKLKITCNHDDFTDKSARFEIQISYNRPIEAFRGVGHVLATSRGLSSFKHPDVEEDDEDEDREKNGMKWSGDVGKELRVDEECLFETVGLMVDCSRNGVLLVEACKFLLRQLALSGTNVLQLYCEDTYEIKGEPFFGYFRGPYTEAELREIDDYAFDLGIEVIACIQTLGHLGQMLQWNKYAGLRDTADVILAEAVETYDFIEKMITAISKPLRSKRIHIGMDEAHGVSEGRYRQFFGYKDSTKVFTDHLRRVNEICVRAGLSPMIWSDMLFCLPAKNNALSTYYDMSVTVAPELTDDIPSDIELVFWNYYQTSSEPYVNKLRQHWELAGRAPWMASGVWTWSRFWTALPFTFATIKAAMIAAKNPELGVKAIMTTIWGDEGNEVDLYSAIPGLFYHAQQAYTQNDEVDVALLKRRFDGITGADFDDYVYASKLDDTQPESQPIDAKTHYTPNLAKFLLWEEPFFSFLSPQYRGYDLESHYSHLATYLDQAISEDFSTMSTVTVPHSIKDFPANSRLQLPALLAKVLSLKCHLRERLVHAYKSDDRDELEALGGRSGDSRMSRLRVDVESLHRLHRANWFSVYKPFGFEVLDLRYGGLRSRLETMHERLIDFLDVQNSSVVKLEELEVELEVAYPGQGPNLMVDYARASRPQFI